MDLKIPSSGFVFQIFFVGPVLDVPTAQGPTVVTSMRLTPSSSYAASEVGPPNLILKGLGALSEKDAVVVGPLHVKGLVLTIHQRT